MSTTSQAAPSQPAEVKILMLHGYTQSGPLFHAKTRALEKLLTKTLAPIPLVPILVYPTGPNRLLPRDIPGYQPAAGQQADGDDDGDGDYQPDTWAWFRKDEATGTYRLLAEGMATVAAAIREAGGVDAVCGFSQGGAMAAVIAAALEPDRPVPEGSDGSWALALRDANEGRPLDFAVSYSGFFGPVDALKWCYEPKLKTPTLHYIGSLDTVVDERRSQSLIDRCVDPVVVVHPGGHHVPVAKAWVMPLACFIKQHAHEAQPKTGL
ncbi:serine hydrolase (FSH1) domain-containing protein [Hirsutella rhossiliensis]|uniref:Serine hydrolase (FSH1) domain-containing protein n=1 Tax=Hirsutella rhossiliensis TaxID=111463 RepID=A0A9P8MZ17_9HYPO|nr:serine hydrolase (FSH1) domain-containing protein [Hirsutella rhossiliensis]KAH0963870.1 serine hydrolase (FSH1) domain-containing protein [Hirsutella rhossiliensis]